MSDVAVPDRRPKFTFVITGTIHAPDLDQAAEAAVEVLERVEFFGTMNVSVTNVNLTKLEEQR